MTPVPDAFAPRAPKILALIASGQLKEPEHQITLALVAQPDSPSARFAMAKLQAAAAHLNDSNTILYALIAEQGQEFALLSLLTSNLARLGDSHGALSALTEAALVASTAEQLLELSVEADRQAHSEIALSTIERALALKPQMDLAHLQHARVLQSTGAIAEAESAYRRLIAKNRLRARAWFALMDLKTSRLNEQELQQLSAHYQIAHTPEEKMLLAFALGKALEDAGLYPQAYARLTEANRLAQRQNPWNAQSFARTIEVALKATEKSADQSAGLRGSELLFLVGLPRSGTTLVEQVLAAHPKVCGAGELPHLPQLIADESTRRGKAYPEWLHELSEADEKRLGEEYLRLSSRWRSTHLISTDKLPENWLHIGLINRILPGARIIDCLRDPTETTWSCFKQLFAPGRVPFSYRFEDLGAFWRCYRTAMAGWARIPALRDRIFAQSYERLISDTDAQVRALLDFCGLEFDARCLSPHLAKRNVHTPSAAQVRQPMRAASMRTPGYGELLQPLRQQFFAQGH